MGKGTPASVRDILGCFLVSGLCSFPECAFGQRATTNAMTYPQAVRLVSQLPVGIQQSEVRQFLERNGFKRAGGVVGNAGWYHQHDDLAAAHTLELIYEPIIDSRKRDFPPELSTSRLQAACIRSNEVFLFSIPLSNSPPSAAAAPARPSRTLNLDSFRFDWPTTTVQDVVSKVGEPDRDVGSGVYIFLYQLSDGSLVWIWSADGTHIGFVRHGTTNTGITNGELLYKRK
jgi:hypothetical protein